MSFIGNISPQWIEEQYRVWRDAPEMVSREWRAFFEGFDLSCGDPTGRGCLEPEAAVRLSAVHALIHRYREIGHLLACTDPLSPCKIDHPLLSFRAFGLDETDLDRTLYLKDPLIDHLLNSDAGTSGGGERRAEVSIRQIVSALRETYCRSVGVEFMHIHDPAQREWLIDRMEPVENRPMLLREERLAILGKLRQATMFEGFLNRNFLGQTRFSLEGGEVLIPQLCSVVTHAAALGVTDLILGMPHRGRLNVLANVFRRPLENIFAEFTDNVEFGIVGEGDVKYHRGFSIDMGLPGGETIHLTLATNPSHLEAIDPVVEGKCRARQERYGEKGWGRVLPVLIHGDAAFAGQGVVAETFNLSQLSGYRTGGTLHIVLNNQIGFTTLPADARSSLYATDAAKSVMAPVFHVHGEDPEAVVHATRLALDYRQTFGRDAVVEIICYRRRGHNEGDEPYFTQPLMYAKIKDRPPVDELYRDRLLETGIPPEEVAAAASRYPERLEEATGKKAEGLDGGFGGLWSGISEEYSPYGGETGVDGKDLLVMADALSRVPEGFTPHPKVEAVLNRRRDAVVRGDGIDWGCAEALALASLMAEGCSVRLSGQDVRRGTFSQRHCVLFDVKTEKTCSPIAASTPGGRFNAYDSMLAEFSVLGFEYGYAMESPFNMVIWEAQYGDFANGAQVVIDEFVTSSETKWNRANGLVILLPHGFEGQGPDHSSARPERILQLCADNNVQVALPTEPSQYFHLLRRQMKQPFRKPLIVLTPKGMLRHPLCASRLTEFTAGRFREVIPGDGEREKVRSVLICCGKVYYELLERKRRDGRKDVDLVRVEQLYPLRDDILKDALGRYGKGVRFSWVQEEPENMGAWIFIRPHLREIIGREPRYVGRRGASSPAVGSHRLHREEQERIIKGAFNGEDDGNQDTRGR